MARNLFLLAALALVAGCTSPTEPPSSSGIEDLTTPSVAPAAPAPATPAATPAAVPAKGKLPLGEVRRK
jgi:hypothetical protein